MNQYGKQISPWGVFKISFPTSPNQLINRYRKRSDAEEYAKILSRSTGHEYQVIFDATT
ncbi:MAG TPA: hypothetical protein VK203_07805 [Nostocaceae cyanobacterium]|nr:hypothetical protein [Nostocaceae cyanobacterium]